MKTTLFAASLGLGSRVANRQGCDGAPCYFPAALALADPMQEHLVCESGREVVMRG